MTSLFTELKRRNVFRVGVAYAIVAWLLIEITATTFPILYRPLFDFLRADPRYSEVLGRANPEFRDRFGFER